MKKKIISFFSGCGGLDLGFKWEDFEIIFANDFEKDQVETYKNNIGNHIVLGDIRNIDSKKLPKNIDVVLGGFPCQGFSIANKNRSLNDKRNYLYKEMIRMIKETNPKIFVAENVKGLLNFNKGNFLKNIISDLEKLGYVVDWKLLNTKFFNVPQSRERIIIIGNKIGVKNKFPEPKKQNKLISVKDVISDLQKIKVNDEENNNKKGIYNHISSMNVQDKFFGRKFEIKQSEVCDYLNYWRKKGSISVKSIDKILGYKHTAGHWFRKDNKSGSIPKPNDWIRLKKILNFDEKFDEKVTTIIEKKIKFEQSLRITNWNKPSDTITATSPEIHINKKRRLSARECARIQTFPDDFVFTGSLNSIYRQIGNAVPPIFAREIAICIKNMLSKKSAKTISKIEKISKKNKKSLSNSFSLL